MSDTSRVSDAAPKPDRAADPVLLAIVQKQLDHITRQMGAVMTRTARSPIFSESHDFSCFLGTADGTVVAQADGLPIHSGGGGFALRAVLDKQAGEMEEGDVFLLSDPYVAGGNHLPDWTMIRPVFVSGTLCGFAANRAHQSDIGGGAAGTYNPEATEIFHEGIRLPVLRLVEKGRIRKDLWELLLLNTRYPELMDGDLQAMLGSLRIGAARMTALLSELGVEDSAVYLEGVLGHGERMLRAEIAALKDGVTYGEDGSDTDCFQAVDVPVKVRLTVDGDTMTFDFTGSAPQVRGFKNSSLANTHSAVYLALATFFEHSIPRNGGTYRAVTIVAPRGSVVNALPPAPMTMNTVFPAMDIVNACWKALAQVDPGRALSGWGKSVNGISSGRTPAGDPFVMYHWHSSPGGGAMAGRDGYPVTGPLPTLGGLVMPNVETYERVYPCRIHLQEFRCDSAGAGRYRGGPSVAYEAEILVPSQHAMRNEGLRRPSGFGTGGGHYGAQGMMEVSIEGEPRRPAPQYAVERGGPMRIWTHGCAGGGWGDPLERDPESVARDVLDGIVSVEQASAVYGVVITGDGLDRNGTAQRRADRRAAGNGKAGGQGI